MAQIELRDRAPRALAVDAALGALVVGVLATAITAHLGTTTRQPAAAYAFAVGLGALMLVRRRWPVGTLLVTAAALLGYYALDFPPVGLVMVRSGRVRSGRRTPGRDTASRGCASGSPCSAARCTPVPGPVAALPSRHPSRC